MRVLLATLNSQCMSHCRCAGGACWWQPLLNKLTAHHCSHEGLQSDGNSSIVITHTVYDMGPNHVRNMATGLVAKSAGPSAQSPSRETTAAFTDIQPIALSKDSLVHLMCYCPLNTAFNITKM
jgi:hypothetical protein